MSNFDPDNNWFHRVLWILFCLVGIPLFVFAPIVYLMVWGFYRAT